MEGGIKKAARPMVVPAVLRRLMGIELVCTYVLIALLYLFVKDVGGQPAA